MIAIRKNGFIPVRGSSSVGIGASCFGTSTGLGFTSETTGFTTTALGLAGAFRVIWDFLSGFDAVKSLIASAPFVMVDHDTHTAAIAVILYELDSVISSSRATSTASGESTTHVRVAIRSVLLSVCFVSLSVIDSTSTASVNTTRICLSSITLTILSERSGPVEVTTAGVSAGVSVPEAAHHTYDESIRERNMGNNRYFILDK